MEEASYTGPHFAQFHLYKTFIISKSIETGSSLLIAKAGGGEWRGCKSKAKGSRVPFWHNENILKL